MAWSLTMRLMCLAMLWVLAGCAAPSTASYCVIDITTPPPRRVRATGPGGAAVLPIAPWPKRHGALRCSMVQRKQDEGVAALALAKATSPDFVGYWQRHRVI